jgi:hypothetical protein
MMNAPRGRFSRCNNGLQRGERQTDIETAAQGKADNAMGAGIITASRLPAGSGGLPNGGQQFWIA